LKFIFFFSREFIRERKYDNCIENDTLLIELNLVCNFTHANLKRFAQQTMMIGGLPGEAGGQGEEGICPKYCVIDGGVFLEDAGLASKKRKRKADVVERTERTNQSIAMPPIRKQGKLARGEFPTSRRDMGMMYGEFINFLRQQSIITFYQSLLGKQGTIKQCVIHCVAIIIH
uniref:Uncharacterized protein n=1 Tax=Parascaris equorum TaxID=6256 RepID=A0A914RVF8_PAREQ